MVENRLVPLVLAAGISLASLGMAQVANAADFLLTSPAFKDGGMLTLNNAGNQKERNPNCVGQNVSPPLQWSGAPADTKSFVLLMFDPEGRGGLGVSHWVAYGIPPSVTGFAEGEVSKDPRITLAARASWALVIITGRARQRALAIITILLLLSPLI